MNLVEIINTYIYFTILKGEMKLLYIGGEIKLLYISIEERSLWKTSFNKGMILNNIVQLVLGYRIIYIQYNQ